MSRLALANEMSIDAQIASLYVQLEELKAGRAFTSGRSGILGYTVGDTSWNNMSITVSGVTTTGSSFVVNGSGSVKITHTFTPAHQQYPIVTPYLIANANNVDMTYYMDGNTPPWRAAGSGWSISSDQYLTVPASYIGASGTKRWVTYIYYSSSVPITIKLNFRLKSTDSGSFITEVVVS